ncbi:hypothetical protein [Gordonia amicalis]|uniref:hypothetical protein n=1 Tax=Gordonia amicalis TaxID=89053 RepID=UPI0015F61D49|nr:hypothetical protein [Gordonia amicalis]MBA5847042.1 hypothetical protein [Gordonia amicalis]
MRKLRAILRRISASVIDQAVSSLTSLGMSVAIASQVNARSFGAFGVAFVVYVLLLGAFRASIGESLLVRTDKSPTDSSAVFTAAVLVAVPACGLTAIVGFAIGGELRGALLGLAVILPFALIQDAFRYIGFSVGRPGIALMGDIVWALTQAVLFAAAIIAGSESLFAYMALWAAAAVVSLLAMWGKFRPLLQPSELLSWLKQRQHLWPRFLAEYFCVSGVQQSALFVLAIFGGLSQAGGYRAAQVVLGPANVVALGAAVVVLPTASALARAGSKSQTLFRFSATVSVALATMTLTYVGLLLLIPDEIGSRLLGDSWSGGRDLFLLCGVLIVISNISYGATVMIRATENAKASLRLRVVFIPFTLAMMIYGAWFGGASSMVVAMSCVGVLQSVAWWALYTYLVRRRPAVTVGGS